MAGLHKLHRELLRIQWLIKKQAEGAREKVAKLREVKLSSLSSSPSGGKGREYSMSGIKSSGMSVMEVTSGIGDGQQASTGQHSPESPPATLSTLPSEPPPSNELQLPEPTAMGMQDEDVVVKEEAEPGNDEIEEDNPFKELDDLVPMDDLDRQLRDSPVPSHPGEDSDLDEEAEYIPSSESEEDEDPPSSSSSPSPSSSEPPPSPPITKRRKRTPEPGPSPSKKPKSSNGQSATPSHLTTAGGVISKTDSKPPPPGQKMKTEYLTKRHRKRPPLILPLVKTTSGTSQYCDLCKELCPSSEIRDHLVSKHNVQDFIVQCPNPSCPYVFSCRRKLEKHLHSGRAWSLKVCRRKARLPTTAPLNKCQACGFKTKYMIEFGRHLRGHEFNAEPNEKIIPCPLPDCPQTFALEQSVEEHVFTHDYEDELQRPKAPPKAEQNCDLCGERMPISQIVSHLEEVHYVGDYISKCPNPVCEKAFSCRVKMEKHLGIPCYKDSVCRIAANLPENRSNIKCDTCQEEVCRVRFQRHLQRHECQHPEKILACPIPGCEERYALRQSMEEHLFIHDFRPPLKSEQVCSVCKHLVKIEEISNHLREAHEVADIIPCKRWPLQFHDWESLLDHLDEHRSRKGSRAGGGGFACDLCDNALGFKFLTYDDLRGHFFNVHKIGKKFICENCDSEFFSRQSLSLHQQTRHSLETGADPATSVGRRRKATKRKLLSCDLCPGVTFTHRDSFRTHNILEHGAPPALCKFCSKPFTSFFSLRKHERAHMGLEMTYKCSFENCNRVFQDRSRLTYHERGDHRDALAPKLYICETCGKGFNTPYHLRVHVKKVHSGEKGPRRICDVCGESFATAATLRNHNLIHTGVRPHECNICGQAFRHRNALVTHLKAHAEKGDNFKPNGPMKKIRKRAEKN